MGLDQLLLYFALLDLDFSRKMTFNLLLPFWGIIYFARDAILYNVFCTKLGPFYTTNCIFMEMTNFLPLVHLLAFINPFDKAT